MKVRPRPARRQRYWSARKRSCSRLPADQNPDLQILSGTISDISYHGNSYRVIVAKGGGGNLRATIPRAAGLSFEPGQPVTLSWRADAARLLPDDGHLSDAAVKP